jgi:hypothetical protein
VSDCGEQNVAEYSSTLPVRPLLFLGVTCLEFWPKISNYSQNFIFGLPFHKSAAITAGIFPL